MATLTQANKNTTTISQADKGSATANLWSENNTPWDPDTTQPWQDETVSLETDLTQGAKQTTTLTNQDKS